MYGFTIRIPGTTRRASSAVVPTKAPTFVLESSSTDRVVAVIFSTSATWASISAVGIPF